MSPREVIIEALSDLDTKLGQFEQTTHGQLNFGDPLEAVGYDLRVAWHHPSAYNISNLSQSIRQFVEREQAK